MSKLITTKKKMDTNKKSLLPHKIVSADIGITQCVKTFPALIDKYLRYISKDGIPFDFILVAMALITIQDNWTGKLQEWLGWYWIILKCLFLIMLYIISYIKSCLSHSIKNKKYKNN